MRGALLAFICVSAPLRIIPADAGSTVRDAIDGYESEDHPRGCGEHKIFPNLSTPAQGSSPRMRGAQSSRLTVLSRPRIIPADAGSTSSTTRWNARYQDHPRGCGEHAVRLIDLCYTEGSSPRMRGAQGGHVLGIPVLGIIPADAGSTSRTWAEDPASKDHPRGCWEHCRQLRIPSTAAGSSPRMRGARHEQRMVW